VRGAAAEGAGTTWRAAAYPRGSFGGLNTERQCSKEGYHDRGDDHADETAATKRMTDNARRIQALALVMVIFVVASLVLGGGGAGGADGKNVVTYRVTGTSDSFSVSYEDGGITKYTRASPPWSERFTARVGGFQSS
jgi:hypothetical protein